jgi:hypothetical protein
MPYFVTMTDKFFSGWADAEGKTAKYVVECATYEQAEQIERAAKARPEMRRVTICSTRPSYSPDRYQVTTRAYDQLGEVWKS